MHVRRHARRSVGTALVLGVAAAIGFITYTVMSVVSPSTEAAPGTTYVVSSLHQVLDPTSPTYIDSLTFNVSPRIPAAAGSRVVVSVDLSLDGPTYECRSSERGDVVTCSTTVPHLTTRELTMLNVVVIP